MSKYNRMVSVEAFQLPIEWKGEDAFDVADNNLVEFKAWATKQGLRYVHKFCGDEIPDYWNVTFIKGGTETPSNAYIDVCLFDKAAIRIYQGNWVVKEYSRCFTVYTPKEFERQYKKVK